MWSWRCQEWVELNLYSFYTPSWHEVEDVKTEWSCTSTPSTRLRGVKLKMSRLSGAVPLLPLHAFVAWSWRCQDWVELNLYSLYTPLWHEVEDVKNGWSCTSTPTICLRGVDRDSFTSSRWTHSDVPWWFKFGLKKDGATKQKNFLVRWTIKLLLHTSWPGWGCTFSQLLNKMPE